MLDCSKDLIQVTVSTKMDYYRFKKRSLQWIAQVQCIFGPETTSLGIVAYRSAVSNLQGLF